MTITERKLIFPELTVPADHDERVAEAMALVEELTERVTHLGTLTAQICETNDDCLRTLLAHGMSINYDDILEIVGDFTGWYKVWNEIGTLTDLLGGGDRPLSKIHKAEEDLGGERIFPKGTRSMVALPNDGEVVEMRVEMPPRKDDEHGWMYPLVTCAEGQRYFASHEEVKAGLIDAA